MIDRERALAIQLHAMRDCVRMLGASSPGARIVERDGVTAAVVPACPERSLPNSVVFDDPAALAGMLGELAGLYEEAGIEAWTVWVPDLDAESIAVLGAAGHSFDGQPLAMTLELEGWRSPPLGGLDWDTEVDPWLLGELNDLAYGIAPEVGLGRGLVEPPPHVRLYQARIEGRPVSVLGTMDHEDDRGFYFVATHPEHRGRGLARGLMSVALADAQQRGMATSSLQSSALGQPVYERLGYQGAFRFPIYARRRVGSQREARLERPA
jgi:GNAT superfamily N-acetyltransferase